MWQFLINWVSISLLIQPFGSGKHERGVFNLKLITLLMLFLGVWSNGGDYKLLKCSGFNRGLLCVLETST